MLRSLCVCDSTTIILIGLFSAEILTSHCRKNPVVVETINHYSYVLSGVL